DLENIHALGEGWVGEEAMAVGVYCALRYQNDFAAGIRAAVNHCGDSDSTGAVCGNILGAWIGDRAVGREWKDDLELEPLIREIGGRLAGYSEK
ncbi:MAG: ADP-ribosylglycohydrolase family protein, partial [Lachnospiraceae bacterium]|nr:ADP-ribosylglycohydrolase family protein [Lachnospiraceae bacterium]